MAITLYGTLNGAGSATTISGPNYTGTIDVSTLSLQSGDVLVLNIVDGFDSPSITITAKGDNSGNANTVANLYKNNTNSTNQGVFLLTQGSTVDTQITITTSNNVHYFSWTLFQYRGVNTTTPLDVTSVTATGTGTDAVNPGAITPSTAGAVAVVCYAASQRVSTYWTTPTDVADYLAQNDGQLSGLRRGMGAMADYAWTSGAFDPAALTGGDGNAYDSWAAVTLALRPAATGGGSSSKYMIITSGTSFTTPSDWNNSNNKIHCIGAGGSGSSTYNGGGGAYAVKSNVTLSGTVSYQIGAAGGSTTVPSGTAHTWVVSNTTVRAGGAPSGGAGGTVASSVGDTRYAGGAGGSTVAAGGAAGPNGAGGSGTTAAGGTGDNGFGGTGGASSASSVAAGAGNPGTEWTDNSGGVNNGISAGSGGGGGGNSSTGAGGAAGLYGGGGGGSTRGTTKPGAKGLIVLEWVAISAPTILNATTRTIMPYSHYTMLLNADQSVTWSITGGANSADFSLNGSTLTLTNVAAPNTSKVVQVTATNSTSQTTSATLTLNTLPIARRRVQGY